MVKVFTEENGRYSVDFSNADWATDQIHQMFHEAKVELSDVDFAAEKDGEVLLVEYKNANIPGAADPDAFKPSANGTKCSANIH